MSRFTVYNPLKRAITFARAPENRRGEEGGGHERRSARGRERVRFFDAARSSPQVEIATERRGRRARRRRRRRAKTRAVGRRDRENPRKAAARGRTRAKIEYARRADLIPRLHFDAAAPAPADRG